jgi:RNA-directed DNA polymerase
LPVKGDRRKQQTMQILKKIKKSGSERTVYAPNKKEKEGYKRLLPSLNEKAKLLVRDAHGFMPGRSPVTNALSHLGYDCTFSCDIKDFFDSVTPEMLSEYLSKEEIEAVLYEGAPRQGLPTSPPVANLAASRMDQAIKEALQEVLPESWVYTRYADDISVSWQGSNRLYLLVLKTVEGVLNEFGFLLSRRKTRFQWAKVGRRVICGIAIDNEKGLFPCKRTRKALKKAVNKDPNSPKAKGLTEWSRLRLPREAY